MSVYQVGQTIKTKKPHPCGSDLWVVVRAGADYKIKCQGCGRTIMLSYEDLKKRVKQVI